ncbi:MAG TPA: PEGA domain-containing protein [Vicinamibacterales bacterium]|nr:PEGA domain-containing protein [Vicinamibacterales bacterium]
MLLRVLVIAAIGAAVAVGLFFLFGRQPTQPSTSGARESARTRPATGARPTGTPEAPAAASPAAAGSRDARRPPAPAAAEPESAPASPELGTLRIDSDVPGAQVFIDRQFVGTTPMTAERVSPGTHQLTLAAEGFDGIRQTIDVEPGPRELTFRFREVRLDATLAVVHKHRIGSCRGRLVADVDGLRYEAAEGDDSFSSPLAGLETFQVDYLEKNLRIALRKGRTYNFTDPDGNADRLFVFHRDVENARRRLGD